MHRRRVLQIGAAAATLPLAGCGAPPEEPKTAAAAPPAPSAAPAPPATAAPSADSGAPPAPDAPPAGSAAPAADEEKPPESQFSRVIARVGKNHGHVLTVTFEDVKAGVEKTYEMRGKSNHPHQLTLTADDMKALLGGKLLRTQSNKGLSHVHRVIVRCAPPVDPPEWVSACKVEFSGQDEHELIIPAADMAAKADRTYDVQGLAGHPHQVTLTAADFEKLAKGEGVSLKTSRDEKDAHLHVVFIQYKPPKTT